MTDQVDSDNFVLSHPFFQERSQLITCQLDQFPISIKISVRYLCVRNLTNPVSAAHPVFASAEAEYGYRSAISNYPTVPTTA